MPALLKYDPKHHKESQNFLLLLISLVVLIILPSIASHFNSYEITLDVLISVVIIIGIYTTTDNAYHLKIGIALGFTALLTRWLCIFLPDPGWTLFVAQVVSGLVFLSYISFHLAKSIIRSRTITISTIYGAVAGFLLLGLLSGHLFMLLDLFVPGSLDFSNSKTSFDYLYFSYVILTGIGFGDITPSGEIAKSLSVLIGVFGQIYLTVLIAILIGKFLSASNNERHELD